MPAAHFCLFMVMEEAAFTVKTSDQDNCVIQLQELQQLRKQCDKGKLGELKNPKRSRCKSSPSPLAMFSHAFSHVFSLWEPGPLTIELHKEHL